MLTLVPELARPCSSEAPLESSPEDAGAFAVLRAPSDRCTARTTKTRNWTMRPPQIDPLERQLENAVRAVGRRLIQTAYQLSRTRLSCPVLAVRLLSLTRMPN